MLQEHYELCQSLRHELHQHPELSGQEVWTKARLIRFLQEHTGVEIVDKGDYFYAIYHGKKPAIAFRADYDALPIDDKIPTDYRSQFDGLGHKCGHDGHSATLCGLVLEVERIRPEREVIFLFQPAEETGEGAKICQSVFNEQDISEFYAYHNYPTEPYKMVSVMPGTICLTSKGLSLYFEGKTSHASQPEAGINPAYTIAKVIAEIERITNDTSLFEKFVRCTIVEVSVGEKAFGVSAGKGVLRLTIRAYEESELALLEQMIVEHANKLSIAAGIKFHYDEQDYFPATVNHQVAVDKLWQACEKINQPIRALPEFFRSSEDYGYYIQKVPGAMFFIGDGEDYPKLHTIEFDFPDELIKVGVDVFSALITA